MLSGYAAHGRVPNTHRHPNVYGGLWFRGTVQESLRLWEIGTARSTMWEIGTFCRFERMLELPAKTTQTRSVFKLPSAPCLLIASRLSSRPTPSRTKKGSNMLLTASCRYTILTPSHRAHHCLRRPSGGPAGGYCRSSADPVACGAPRAHFRHRDFRSTLPRRKGGQARRPDGARRH